MRPVSLQRLVCSTALGTGGGAGQRSSQRASGKDHRPSSRQVRVLFVPEQKEEKVVYENRSAGR